MKISEENMAAGPNSFLLQLEESNGAFTYLFSPFDPVTHKTTVFELKLIVN